MAALLLHPEVMIPVFAPEVSALDVSVMAAIRSLGAPADVLTELVAARETLRQVIQ